MYAGPGGGGECPPGGGGGSQCQADHCIDCDDAVGGFARAPAQAAQEGGEGGLLIQVCIHIPLDSTLHITVPSPAHLPQYQAQ
jgi:hypothetical protein